MPASAAVSQPATDQAADVSPRVAVFRSGVRWTLNIVALVVLGPLAAVPISALADRHGGGAVSLLVNTSLASGLFALAAVGALGVLGGALGSRLSGSQMGRTVAGLTVAWAALWVGDMGDTLRAAGPTMGTVLSLIVESGLLLVVGVAMLYATLTADRPRVKAAEADGKSGASALSAVSPADFLKRFTAPAALLGIAIGVVAALFGAWLVARDDMRGQAFFAGILGAILAGAAARLAGTLLPGGDPKTAHRPEVPAVGVLLAGVLAPLVLIVVPGLGNVDEAARAGTLTGPGALTPLDWLAGALLGTSIGINWAGSLLERENAK
ncbi:MAG: hypothetical protein AAF297_08730 [Planctomycetota bacterium]